MWGHGVQTMCVRLRNKGWRMRFCSDHVASIGRHALLENRLWEAKVGFAATRDERHNLCSHLSQQSKRQPMRPPLPPKVQCWVEVRVPFLLPV